MYRIISTKTIGSSKEEKELFYIQRKSSFLKRKLLGIYWSYIHTVEDVKEYTKSFDSYEEAETYLYKTYFNDYGQVCKSGNLYSFYKYTFVL